MKEAWVHLEKWSTEAVTAALESGADALVLPEGLTARAGALGRIRTVSSDGDPRPGEDVLFEPLAGPEDERRIAKLLSAGRTVVLVPAKKGRPWEVIPLENLVAVGSGRLLVPAASREEAALALGVLEKGVAGIVIRSHNPALIRTMVSMVKAIGEKEPLATARIERISPAGMGDRVCVDTCSLMREGEGLLVGNSSGFLFLVQAEALENPYVAPRPFRVNAGPVHAYVRVPGARTRYLSELEAGQKVLGFGNDGGGEEAVVGRVKIERRPLLLIEAECNGKKGSILLQNAETIRLVDPGGRARSVTALTPGDEVMAAVEDAGRHFGMKIEEKIEEK